MYNELFLNTPDYVLVDYSDIPCLGTGSTIRIESGTTVVWDESQLVLGPIEVETGATLIIRCLVRLTQDAVIVVHRGAQLRVEGGFLTSVSENCLWRGIRVEGHDSSPQPNIDIDGNLLSPLVGDGAGYVYLANGTIQRASIGVSTKGAGGHWQHDYFGGLIFAKNTCFHQNTKSFEFMRYQLPNNSYFENCKFVEGNQGGTIWACNGIDFISNQFLDMGANGIFGGNYTCNIIDGNSFMNVNNAIFTNVTFPYANLGQLVVKKQNSFTDNNSDIRCNGTPNTIFNTDISDRNVFYGGTGSNIGIRTVGAAALNIADNQMLNKRFGTFISSSGLSPSEIKCNLYHNSSNNIFGAILQFNNDGLKILDNDFNNNVTTEILIRGTANVHGSISGDQGSVAEPAENCFDNEISAISALPMTTDPFRYYVYEMADDCKRPTNNISDLGTNNYFIENSNGTFDHCSSSGGGIIDYSKDDYDAAKNTISQKKEVLDANPENLELYFDYKNALLQKEIIFSELAKDYVQSKDYAGLETFLWEDGDVNKKRDAVGLRFAQMDYEGAESLLDLIPITGIEDTWFEGIMQINLKCEPNNFDCILSSSEEDMLHTVAASGSTLSGYACGLLFLIKGYDCQFDVTERIDSVHEMMKEETNNSFVQIFPNPSSDYFAIQANVGMTKPFDWTLVDSQGKLIKSGRISNVEPHNVNVENLAAGLYTIQFTAENQRPISQKLVILKK